MNMLLEGFSQHRGRHFAVARPHSRQKHVDAALVGGLPWDAIATTCTMTDDMDAR